MSFDDYTTDYGEHVQAALPRHGFVHSAILAAKADHLLATIEKANISTLHRPLILDIGCGIGSMEKHLSGGGRRLVGVDPAVRPLLRARREAAAVGFSAFDGVRLPFADGTFDVVFAASVLHHVVVDQRRHLLEEAHRVARPGGVVLIIEHNPRNPLTRRIVSRCEFDRDAVLLLADEACELLRAVGLHRVERNFILFTPWRGRFWSWLDSRFRHWPLGGQYIAFAVRGRAD